MKENSGEDVGLDKHFPAYLPIENIQHGNVMIKALIGEGQCCSVLLEESIVEVTFRTIDLLKNNNTTLLKR